MSLLGKRRCSVAATPIGTPTRVIYLSDRGRPRAYADGWLSARCTTAVRSAEALDREATGADLLVAMFNDRESPAVWLLGEQDITHYDLPVCGHNEERRCCGLIRLAREPTGASSKSHLF
jgi:hypothetical protein